MNSQEKLTVVCRPARQSDTQEVMELTSTIWEGDDYVPKVWQDWLADPEGILAVAEHEDRVIGLGKLTLLAPGEWWLEGLRTHPDFEGHGVASHLHEYLLNFWLQNGKGSCAWQPLLFASRSSTYASGPVSIKRASSPSMRRQPSKRTRRISKSSVKMRSKTPWIPVSPAHLWS